MVEVHVIVDEKGEVVTARSMSGHPMLKDAAETAARKATFSRAKLSSEPGKVYGIINYDFGAPPAEASLATDNATSAVPTEVEKTPAREPVSSPASSTPQNTSVNTDSAKVTNSPEPAAARYERALTYLAPGSSSDSLAVLKEAIQRNPNDGAAYRKLGIAYAGLGQNKEAVAVFKMAIKISPELLDAQGYLHLGHAYLELGKNSEALRALKQAVYLVREQALDAEGKPNPNSPSPVALHYALSLAYQRLGRYQEAIKELTVVVALNPKLAEAYYGLAVAYIGMGDRRSAEKQLAILTPLNQALAEKIVTALGKNAPSPGCLTIACRR
jgi:tetratricopeptide (TPR) repeat protein